MKGRAEMLETDRLRYLPLLTVSLLALCFAGASSWLYYTRGFSWGIVILWILGLVMTATAYAIHESAPESSFRYQKNDIEMVAVLLLLISPLYLMALHAIPYQICTDEIVCMLVDRERSNAIPPDFFGITSYFAFPAGSFALIGTLSRWLGGINLHNVRAVNGLFGLGIVVGGYFLFRFHWTRRMSFLAAILLGTNQSLIGISRMALLHSLAVFIEVIAFVALYMGFSMESSLILMVGGALAGLGAYVYYSSRIILLVWGVFLLQVFWRERHGQWKQKCRRFVVPSLVGFFLSSAPMGLASLKTHQVLPDYAKHQLILFPEGRALLRDWEGTTSTALALWRNTWHGIGAFNNNQSDRGYIYVNPYHGFVDPLSGIFLWIGLGIAVFSKGKRLFNRFAVCGFLSIWLFLSLLTTKNPEFERMLALLPFAIYFIFLGMKRLSSICVAFLARRLLIPKRHWPQIGFVLVVSLTLFVAAWNLRIYQDQYRFASIHGDFVGYLVRYVESRKSLDGYNYYFVMDNGRGYFWFGDSSWPNWAMLFAGEGQSAQVVDPRAMVPGGPRVDMRRPMTLMMNAVLWNDYQNRLLSEFPRAHVRYMTPNRSHVAVEIF